MAEVKKYFAAESVRNRKNAELFERMIKCAFGDYNAVIIGHHLTFEDTRGTAKENILTENEIPSADTLIFDHDIMHACFGKDAIMVMRAMAEVRTDYRDDLLAEYVKMYGHPSIKDNAKPETPAAGEPFMGAASHAY